MLEMLELGLGVAFDTRFLYSNRKHFLYGGFIPAFLFRSKWDTLHLPGDNQINGLFAKRNDRKDTATILKHCDQSWARSVNENKKESCDWCNPLSWPSADKETDCGYFPESQCTTYFVSSLFYSLVSLHTCMTNPMLLKSLLWVQTVRGRLGKAF